MNTHEEKERHYRAVEEEAETADPACEFVRATILQRRPFSRLTTATLIPIRGRAFKKLGGLYDADSVMHEFDEALRNGEIPEFAESLRSAWASSNYVRNTAANGIVLDEAIKSQIVLDDSDALSFVIDQLGLENGWEKNAQGQQQANEFSEQQERKRLINELTYGGKQSFVVIRPNCSRQRFDVEGRPIEFSQSGMTPSGGAGRLSDPGFAGMTTEDLRTLHANVMQQRKLQSMSKDDLRKIVRTGGEARFEAATTSKLPQPQSVELINPDSGEAISNKTALIKFINLHRENTKRLIQKNGVTVPELARRFEEILNGNV